MTSSIRSHADALRAEITRVLFLDAESNADDPGTDQFVAGFVDLAIHASEGNTKPRDEYLAVIVPSVRASGFTLAVSMAGMVGLAMGGAAVLEGDELVWWYRFCADYTARMATLWGGVGSMSVPPSLLDQIVAASELSPIFARGAITRALRRAGVTTDDLTRSGARTALPEIRRAIEPFLQAKTDAVMRKIEALVD